MVALQGPIGKAATLSVEPSAAASLRGGSPAGRRRPPANRVSALTAACIALLSLACGSRVKPASGAPPLPPDVVVNATGDGESVSGHVGPQGGVFELVAGGLRLTLPAGAVPAEGLTLSLMRTENDGLPAAAARIGDAFRSTPSLSGPSGKWLELRSSAVSPLPPACAGGGAALALEAPPEAGPGDGTHGPALSWQLGPARAESDRLIAELATLPAVRAVFLCGASGAAGLPAREGTP